MIACYLEFEIFEKSKKSKQSSSLEQFSSHDDEVMRFQKLLSINFCRLNHIESGQTKNLVVH